MNTGLILALGLALAPRAASAKDVPMAVAQVMHACGELRFAAPSGGLDDGELADLRQLIAYLYDGAVVTVSYPGAPRAGLNEATKRRMLKSEYIRGQLKVKDPDPKDPQVLKDLASIYATDPVTWHVHTGPAPESVRKIIYGSAFSTRAGRGVVKLIEDRLDGTSGQRDAILSSIRTKFGVKAGKLEGSEECHIGDSLGRE